MITEFAEYNKDYTEFNIYKMAQDLNIKLTEPFWTQGGDKEYGWTDTAKSLIRKKLLNKVVSFLFEQKEKTELILDITFVDSDIPMWKLKFPDNRWWHIKTDKKFKIWNEDSEVAQNFRLKLVTKQYNL